MTQSELLNKAGVKIKKKTRGWYTYQGINFNVDFWEEACETSWWEVCIHDDETDPRVFEFFEDYNQFDTKKEVVGLLYQFDKSLTK